MHHSGCCGIVILWTITGVSILHLHAQAVTVLQEAVSESTGERTQIIFRRDAEISSADLLELIDKVWLKGRSLKFPFSV